MAWFLSVTKDVITFQTLPSLCVCEPDRENPISCIVPPLCLADPFQNMLAEMLLMSVWLASVWSKWLTVQYNGGDVAQEV